MNPDNGPLPQVGSEVLPTSVEIAPAELKSPFANTPVSDLTGQLIELSNSTGKNYSAEEELTYRGPRKWYQKVKPLAWVVAAMAVLTVGGFFLGNFTGKNSHLQIGGSADLSGVKGPLVADNKLKSLEVNFDTLINDKSFKATGAVSIQNDLTNGFTVQNAAGANLLVADTKNQKVGIGTLPSGAAKLQVGGDIASSGALTSSTGAYTLNSQGLTIGGVLVCTSQGCKSSVPIPAQQNLNTADIAFLDGSQTFTGINQFTANGNVFVGDGSGLSALKASNITSGTLADARLSANVALLNGNQTFNGNNTFSNQLQASGGINSTGYSINGTAGANIACGPTELLQQGSISSGIVTGGNCVTVAGGTTPSLQQVYDASLPAAIVLSNASGPVQFQDAATPLGTNLFEVTNNGGATKYFAANSSGVSVFGNVNTTGQYQVNGSQISSSNLSNDANLAKLNGNQTFTGNNTFSSASNSFTGDGSGLTSLNASNVSSGTLNDARLSANVPLKNAANTFSNTNLFKVNSTTAFQVQNAATSNAVLTADTTNGRTILGTASALDGNLQFLSASGSGSISLLANNPGASNFTLNLPAENGTLCSSGSICAGYASSASVAGKLNKNAVDTSSAAVTNPQGFLYSFSNTSGAVASGVLKLDNGTNTNSTLSVTASGNPSAGQALILANNANGAAAGNLIDLQNNSTSKFSVDASGNVLASGNLSIASGKVYEINGVQITSAALSNDANLAKLNGNQTFTGNNTFSSASNSFTGDGSGLTSLNASNVSSGTLNDARLSANVALLNGTGPQTFSGNNKFTGTVLSQNTSNSAAAFQVQNAAGNQVLTVDTSSGLVALGKASSLSGDLLFYNSGNSGSIALQTANPGASNFTITLPAATGTVCLTTGNCVGVGGTGDILNNGNSFGANVTLGTNDSNNLNFETNNQTQATIAVGGATTFRNSANSASAFQIQNAAGTSNLFIADTTTNRIAINQASATYSLDVAGDINSTTGLRVGGVLVCTNTGCSAAGGSSNYIQNGTSTQTNANFNIRSAATNSVGGVIEGANGQSADLFDVQSFSGATKYLAVTVNGISVGGDADITGQYKVNGSQISSADLSNDANLAKLNGNQTFTGNNTFSSALNSFTGDGSGLTSLNASNVSSGTLNDARLSSNVPLKNAANIFTNTNKVQLTNATAFQVQNAAAADTVFTVDTAARGAGGGNLVKIGNSTGTDGNTTILVLDGASANPSSNLGALNGGLFYNTSTNHINIIENGVVKEVCNKTDTACGSAGTAQTFAVVYTNGSSQSDSTVSLDTTRLGLLIKDNATPLGSTLFGVQNSTGATKYLDVTDAGISVAGNVNATGQYQVNGSQISSANLSNDANLAKLNGNQTFTGNNTFSSASNSFTGDGSGLTSLNANNISSGTLNDSRLSSNVPLKNASNTFTNTNSVQVTSATAFQVQNAAAADTVFTVDTAARGAGGGNLVKIGNSTGTDGSTTILVVDSATSNPSSNLGALNGGLFYNSSTNHINVIENGAVKELCNKSDLGCGSAGTTQTLAIVYANGASQSDSTILLDSTRLGVLIKDNATPIGSTLFGVQNSTGGTKYLDVTSSGITVAGTVVATGNINSSGGVIQTNGTTRLDNSGNLSNIGNVGLSGSISGGTTYSGSGNINTTGGALQTNSVTRVDNSGNLTNIGNFTSTAGTTFSTTGANGFAFKPGTDNSTAFQIQNSSSYQLLNVDTTADATNLITNGSFEANTTGWTAKASATLSSVTSATVVPYIGAGSMQVQTNTSAGGANYSRNFTNSQNYTFSVYVRASGSNFSVFEIGNSNDNSTDTSCLTAQTIVTGSWARISCTFTYTGTTGPSYVYFKQTNSANRTYYIDGAKLETGASATAYHESNFNFNGIITSPTYFQNASDSSIGFQVADSSGTGVLSINTKNDLVNIGSSSATSAKLRITNGTSGLTGLEVNQTTTDDLLHLMNSGTSVVTVDAYGHYTIKNAAAHDSTTAFQVQNSAGNQILTVDTSGNQLVLGKQGGSGLNGIIVFNNSANSNQITLQPAGSQTANYTLQLPALAAGTYTVCTDSGNCAGAGSTLQTAYNNSTSPEITVDGVRGAVTIQDASSPIGANLLEVQSNGGATKYFAVSASGINVTGTASVSSDINTTGGVIQTNSTTRIDNSGNLSNIGNISLSGSISGGTTYSGSGNINTTGGAIQTNSTIRIDNTGNLTNIGTISLSGGISGGTTYSGSGNINTTGGALQTNSTTRVDNSGNLTNIGNETLSGAISGGTTYSGSGNINTTGGALQTNSTTRIDNSGNLTNINDADITGSLATKKGTDFSTTGTSNNVNFGDVSLVRLTGASAQTITGIANGRDGYNLTIVNAGSVAATIKNNSGSSLAANRITTGTGGDLSLPVGAMLSFIYDSSASLWRTSGDTSSLQTAYNNSSTPQITLTSSLGGVVIQDASSPIGADLFTIQSNGGGTKYLDVTSSGITVAGAVVATGNINTSGGAIQTNGTTRIDNSGNLSNIGTISLSGSISGGTTYSGSGNINTTGGVLQTNSTTRVDNSGNLTNIGNLTTSGASTFLTTGANGFTFKPGTDNAAAFVVQDAASNKYIQVDTSGANLHLGNTSIASTVQIGNTTGAVSQTINIGNNSTGSSTNNVNIGSSVAGTTAITGATTVTNRTSGSADSLLVSNSTSTGNILRLQDNSTDVMVVGDGGSLSFTPADATKTVTIGSTSQTGTITLGQSTATNMISIGGSGGSGNTQTISIGGGNVIGSITNINIGSTVAGTTAITGATTVTNRSSGSADTFVVNNSTSTGTIAKFQDNAVNVFQLADGGAATFGNQTDSSTAFQIQNAIGSNAVRVNTNALNSIISNGNFESANAAQQNLWTYLGTPGSVAQDSTQTFSGLNSLKVITTANASNGVKYVTGNGASALAISTTYTISWYDLLNSGSFNDVRAVYARDGSTEVACSGQNTQTVSTSGWTRHTCQIVTDGTSPASTAYIAIEQTAGTARTFWVDAVQVEAASIATGYRETSIHINSRITSPVSIQNNTNSTNAFQVQNSSGANMLDVDTLNSQISFGMASQLSASLVLYNVSGSGKTTLQTSNPGSSSYTITLPAATGTVCLTSGNCVGVGGSGDILNNGNSFGTDVTLGADDNFGVNLRANNINVVTISNGGATVFKNGADSTSAFQIQKNDSSKLFVADTTNKHIYIGDPTADSTAILLVLDSKNTTGDPSGVEGAMYYDSADSLFRCYRNSQWGNCTLPAIDHAYQLTDDFILGGSGGGNIGEQNWAIVAIGTSANYSYNDGNMTPTTTHVGVVHGATAASGTSIGSTLTVNSGGGVVINAGQIWKSAVALSKSGQTNTPVLRAGLHRERGNTTSPTSGVWWEADSATNANWRYCYGTGAAATCAASSVAITDDTWYKLEIRVTGTGSGTSSATFCIDSDCSYTVSAVTFGTSAISPAYTFYNTASAAQDFYVDYMQFSGVTAASR